MKRVLLLVLCLILSSLIAWGWHARQALADFSGILPAYSAKEYCSCRFVMGFEQSYCRGYVEQWLPLSRLEEDSAARRVLAEGLGRRSEALWQGAREGCRLLP